MRPASSLRVAGLVPLSTVDKPGDLTATVFTSGCPWRCPYCHNPHLQRSVGPDCGDAGFLAWSDVMELLGSRRGLLDGVVFSGGEPTMHRALGDAIRDVRDAGFAAFLHTGGPAPDALAELLPLLGWVGFDVKAPFGEYERVTQVPGSGVGARESLRLLVRSGVPFEVRTTVHSSLLDSAALERLADDLADEGVGAWVLQTFRPEGVSTEIGASSMPLDVTDAVRRRVPDISFR